MIRCSAKKAEISVSEATCSQSIGVVSAVGITLVSGVTVEPLASRTSSLLRFLFFFSFFGFDVWSIARVSCDFYEHIFQLITS